MQELSLNVLDVAQNSIKAGAKLTEIGVTVSTTDDTLAIVIKDDGCGMDGETLDRVTDPFYTTRTTRKVGLGVGFFKFAAELTGGSFNITSAQGSGTEVTAVFGLSSIDRMPLGDMNGTIETLAMFNQQTDFLYTYEVDGEGFSLDTREFKAELDGVPLDSPDAAAFFREFLEENTAEVNKGRAF